MEPAIGHEIDRQDRQIKNKAMTGEFNLAKVLQFKHSVALSD